MHALFSTLDSPIRVDLAINIFLSSCIHSFKARREFLSSTATEGLILKAMSANQVYSLPPNTATLPTAWPAASLLGTSTALKKVNLVGAEAFNALVPRMPVPPAPVCVGWRIFGTLQLVLAGVYNVCVSSADGNVLGIANMQVSPLPSSLTVAFLPSASFPSL